MSKNVPAAGRVRSRAPRNAPTSSARMWIAGGVALALVSTIAVIASGYDARETPRAEAGVWVSRDAGQYARVNTDTGELDIVRKVAEPSGMLQSSGRGVLLTNGNGRAWPIDASNPTDLGDGAKVSDGDAQTVANAANGSGSGSAGRAAVSMPDGTREIVGSGRFVGVLTESGVAYRGELAGGSNARDTGGDASLTTEDLEGRLASLSVIAPLDETPQDKTADTEAAKAEDTTDGAAKGPEYQATAIAVSADGEVALYSNVENAVRVFDIESGEPKGESDQLPESAKGTLDPQLTLVGGDWVLLDAERGMLWRKGAAETELKLTSDAVLQGSSRAQPGGAVLVADVSGLWRVAKSGAVQRETEAKGTPARPVEVGGKLYAAWLGQGSGSLWHDGKSLPLQFDDSVRDPGDLAPVFRTNGERAVLSETRTGMLWTLPEGALIPLAQWSISDPPKEDRGTVVVDEVTEQLPPTAVDDAFGVRAGQPAPLPVMLNDFDPNKRDVLTIVPESLGESPLPKEFGTLQLMPDGQSLTVQTAPGATGTATFTYRITDGGLSSEAATVTLTVMPDRISTAPAWCPVEGCQREWRVPALAPGGTLVYPILEGWVDPEGDVLMLSSAEVVSPEDPVRAMVTEDGRLAVRHTDPNAGASEVTLRITVMDDRGESKQRNLQLSVQPKAPAEFTDSAATVKVGEPTVLQPLSRVAGGSGSYTLTNATVQGGSDKLHITPQLAAGTVEVEALEQGSTSLLLNLRDTVTGGEVSGVVRVTATPGGAPLALPPLRAFVRPLADSTVEILDAVPGAKDRALAVSAAKVVDGELRADVIAHSAVRVAGSTADGGPGRIGAVDVTVTEGDAQAKGRLTVFQVPEANAAGAIAVADTATVRAGAIVDIRVLDNDIAPPGDRLLLHPEISGSGAKGELAFASGNVLRYLAPDKPGTYRLSYTTYGASSPELSDVGTVFVTVLPTGSNRDPQPRTITARVAPGEQAEVRVPLSGVDPDGDRVRLTDVASPDDPQVTASLTPAGTRIVVAASAVAKPGQQVVDYSVRDDFDAKAKGKLRIIVMASTDKNSAPIAATDYVRMVPNSTEPAVVRPLDNDIDPARGKLSIVSVEPNVPGGKNSPDYKKLAARVDLTGLKDGRLSITSDKSIGVVSYRYKIKSSATSSTADGLIVVQTSERVGAQAPAVDDTVLNVRDRAMLSGRGVDVMTDKVRWSTGDPSSLKLSLWGKNAKDYRADGNRIIGQYSPEGDLVVFKLTGQDITGAKVSSYGFLLVPPLDELRLTLKAGLKPLSVDEDKSIDTPIQDLVDLGSGDRAELRQTTFSVGRDQASCSAVSSSTVRYTAGKEAPWLDTCFISARLVGQKTWTNLPVPVDIVPRIPEAQLNPLSRSVMPGATESVDLTDMVTWPGGRTGDVSKLRFETSGTGGSSSLFDVVVSGAKLKVSARADALPGNQEVLSISVSGAGESRAPLTLSVGEAPRDLPKGGTLALQCTVGAECGATVIGAPGEHDPFAGKSGGGLKLESVNTSACKVGTFSRVGDDGISVAWSADRVVGGVCTVGFTVLDAQGRTGTGSIEFDAAGVPEAPTSISQTDVDATSVTFSVTVGGQAHPEVTGVSLSGPGSKSCTADGPSGYTCVAKGLVSGEKHAFTAQAVNAVGSSAASTAVTAWAYQAPAAPRVEATAIENPENQDKDHGGVALKITGSSDTKEFLVRVPGQDEPVKLTGPTASQNFLGLPVGQASFTVTPVTAIDLPEVGGSSASGENGEVKVDVIGAPKLPAIDLRIASDTSAKAIFSKEGVAHSAEEVKYGYAIALYPSATPLSCPNPGSGSPEFTGLARFKTYKAIVCASSLFGNSSVESNELDIGGTMPGIPEFKYTVGPDYSPKVGYPSKIKYELLQPTPTLDSLAKGIQYRVNNTIMSKLKISDASLPDNVEARQCQDVSNERSCSAWQSVGAAGAPTPVSVSVKDACYVARAASEPPQNTVDLKPLFDFSLAAAPDATITAKESELVADPDDPTKKLIPITVNWKAPGSQYAALEEATLYVCYTPFSDTTESDGDSDDTGAPQ